jgi:hypothetical protein
LAAQKGLIMRIAKLLIAPTLGAIGFLPLLSGCGHDDHDHDRRAYLAGYRIERDGYYRDGYYRHDRDRDHDWDHDRYRDHDDWRR